MEKAFKDYEALDADEEMTQFTKLPINTLEELDQYEAVLLKSINPSSSEGGDDDCWFVGSTTQDDILRWFSTLEKRLNHFELNSEYDRCTALEDFEFLGDRFSERIADLTCDVCNRLSVVPD